MKKLSVFVVSVMCALMFTSCASVSHSAATGVIYMKQKAPGLVTSNSLGSKVGTAKVTSILGVYSKGDASIEAAAKAAGITKISHVDYEVSSILGIVAKHITIVYGE